MGESVTGGRGGSSAGSAVLAAGHLGELTQVIPPELVDAACELGGVARRRSRVLGARVVVYFCLALALFEHCSYSVLAGPVGGSGQAGVWYRGLRTVAVDGTYLHVPDDPKVVGRYPKRTTRRAEFGYPLLRLAVLIECGTRAVLAAAFGPERDGELHYARKLLDAVDATMVVLADAGFDAAGFVAALAARGGQFVVRSSARRVPARIRDGRLPDRSYLARIGFGVLTEPITVRVIDARVRVTTADGRIRIEQWRLLTSLTDHERYPAGELVELYHQRWQVETTFYSIKATMLDGRVLRSHSIDGIDQEVYALLGTYQGLIRAAADIITARPGLDMDRISFKILAQAAADQVILAAGITWTNRSDLIGGIGRIVLRHLLPARRPHRTKPRTRKNPTTKYTINNKHPTGPTTTQTYDFHTDITIFEKGLDTRTKT